MSPSTPENILVIGSRSYIGAEFCRLASSRSQELIKTGNAGFRVFGKNSDDCDLLDSASVKKCISSLPAGPFRVVVFAVVNKSASNDFRSLCDNQTMAHNLLNALNSTPVSSVLYLSSVDVYGNAPSLPINEATVVAPDTYYGLAKYNCEWILGDSGGLSCPVTRLRIPGVFGSAPRDRSVIGKLASAAKSSGRVEISGDGSALRDYVWVSDLCRLVFSLLPADYNGVLNGVSGKSYSVRETAEMLLEELELPAKVSFGAEQKSRSFDLRFDNAQLKAILPDFQFSDIRLGMRSYASFCPGTHVLPKS